MSTESNKSLIRQFIDVVWNQGNAAAIPEFCVPNSMFAEGIEGQLKAMKTAFPELHFTVDEIVAQNDKVVVKVTQRGTNAGPLVGLPGFGRLEAPVPPTGNKISVTGMFMFTVTDGRIVSYAQEFDQVGLLRQLGWTFTPPEPG